MANDYVGYATLIPLRDHHEKRWWKKLIQVEHDTTPFLPPKIEEGSQEHSDTVAKLWKDFGIDLAEHPWCDSLAEEMYLDVKIDVHNHAVYLSDESYGNPDIAAHLIRVFFEQFDRESVHYMEAAFYCDKPRPGHFGGAAYRITKDEVDVLNPVTALKEKHGD